MKNAICMLFALGIVPALCAQKDTLKVKPAFNTKAGWFSLGARNTISCFSADGAGIGTGGQFRVQLSNTVNTDWFADYITINIDNRVRSEYYHIGWSVLFYPFDKLRFPERKLQPYVLAGHCFDYNKKIVLSDPSSAKDRWGSAVQIGLGSHINVSDRFDVSFTSQYMIHLTRELDVTESAGNTSIVDQNQSSIEGHLLITVSTSYKLFKLWKK